MRLFEMFVRELSFTTHSIAIVASSNLLNHFKMLSKFATLLMVDLDMGSLSDAHELAPGHRLLVHKYILLTVHPDGFALRL